MSLQRMQPTKYFWQGKRVRLRRTVYTQGRYFDEFFYGMTCEEFAERYGDLAANE